MDDTQADAAGCICLRNRAGYVCAATGNRQQATGSMRSPEPYRGSIVPSRLISVLALYSFFIIVSLSWQMDESESNPL